LRPVVQRVLSRHPGAELSLYRSNFAGAGRHRDHDRHIMYAAAGCGAGCTIYLEHQDSRTIRRRHGTAVVSAIEDVVGIDHGDLGLFVLAFLVKVLWLR
jgi:hypothetical protein